MEDVLACLRRGGLAGFVGAPERLRSYGDVLQPRALFVEDVHRLMRQTQVRLGQSMTSNLYQRDHTVQALLSRYCRPPGRSLNSRELPRSANPPSTPGTRVTPRTEDW
jgi:hypothetical protein